MPASSIGAWLSCQAKGIGCDHRQRGSCNIGRHGCGRVQRDPARRRQAAAAVAGHCSIWLRSSHSFVFIGLSILAILIRHAILDDVQVADFRALSVIDTVCFFIGKQCAYFMERPELRPSWSSTPRSYSC